MIKELQQQIRPKETSCLPNVEHHCYHNVEKKSCCGDWNVQGSLGRQTSISFVAKTSKDILAFK